MVYDHGYSECGYNSTAGDLFFSPVFDMELTCGESVEGLTYTISSARAYTNGDGWEFSTVVGLPPASRDGDMVLTEDGPVTIFVEGPQWARWHGHLAESPLLTATPNADGTFDIGIDNGNSHMSGWDLELGVAEVTGDPNQCIMTPISGTTVREGAVCTVTGELRLIPMPVENGDGPYYVSYDEEPGDGE